MPDLKQLARRIFLDTLAAIDIPSTMRRKLQLQGSLFRCSIASIDLNAFHDLRVVAIGKAANAMVDGLKRFLPAGMSFTGVVSAPSKPENSHPGVKCFAGGHPIPNLESWNAAKAILDLLENASERTLIFFLLSGGGSALAELPLDPLITLEELQETHRALVGCGAPIDAINTIRKHLSAIKGGRLAMAAGGATKVTLAITDVPPGKESALASGPTLPDPSTLHDVEKVLQEYSLRKKLPKSIQQWMDSGAMPETPKPGDPAFDNAHFSVLLGIDELFHPAHQAAEAAGCITCCDNTTDDWSIELAANYLLSQLEELKNANPSRRVAVIADGEVSSPVLGNGIGGRNAAFVLGCVEKIAGKSISVLSGGTDGIDGNSPSAGAVADGDTYARAKSLQLDLRDVFQRSDSYTFFKRLGDTVDTGPTGSNLRDLRILIAEP